MLKPKVSRSTKSHAPPPLPSPTQPLLSSSVPRKRTSHACDRCRLMRVKCSGGAQCEKCISVGADCLYGDHKRQRNEKDLVDRAQRIEELEVEKSRLVTALKQVLNDPSYRILEDDQIMELLGQDSTPQDAGDEESVEGSYSSRSTKSPMTRIMVSEANPVAGGGETTSSVVGSPGRQGELHKIIDLDRGIGAVGYIGEMSEMSWMRRCHQYVSDQMGPTTPNADRFKPEQHSTGPGALRYFMDDENLLAVDEDYVDPLHRPPVGMAIILTEACFHAIEGSFQFILHDQFLDLVNSLSQNPKLSSWSDRRWLALANMAWAVGAKWLQLAKLDGPEFPDSHLTYYARARALGLDHRVSFDHPNLEMVHGIGLLAFYLLLNGSVSRAWNTVGNAIRYAMTIGLHLYVLDPSTGEPEQRTRSRTWFSLYNLQMLIAEITGRAPLVQTAHVTVPLEAWEHSGSSYAADDSHEFQNKPRFEAEKLWMNFLESKLSLRSAIDGEISSSVAGQLRGVLATQKAFLYHVRMCQLSEEVADSLYTGRRQIPWLQTQRRIAELQRGLDAWEATLPDDLRVTGDSRASPYPQVEVHLAMYACSVTMMIHRPCLSVIQITNESDRSKEFNVWSAQTCINAAMSMLDQMPDDLVPREVFQVLPWWTLLHYICQAAAVLLLELCLEVQHLPGDTPRVLHAMLKAMSLLARLARDSMSAYKAWRIFSSLLLKAAQQLGETNLAGLIEEAPQPERWTPTMENDLLVALGGG